MAEAKASTGCFRMKTGWERQRATCCDCVLLVQWFEGFQRSFSQFLVLVGFFLQDPLRDQKVMVDHDT